MLNLLEKLKVHFERSFTESLQMVLLQVELVQVRKQSLNKSCDNREVLPTF